MFGSQRRQNDRELLNPKPEVTNPTTKEHAMSLSGRLKQLTNATAARDGDAAVEALRAIEAEHGTAAADLVKADILAHAAREHASKKKRG